MDKLFDGIKEFRRSDFQEHRDLFLKIGGKQEPHTLFIGCSDSRVVPALITRALPGDLFVIRNIANIVPPYRQSAEYLATTSAIEFAVQVLKVENIVVCGHSNCGGCSLITAGNISGSEIPHTMKWLELAGKVREEIDNAGIEDKAEKAWRTEQMNIVEQMNHLCSYPYIKEKYRNGELSIMGWYYIIETGEVYNYNRDTSLFEKIE